MKVLGLEAKLLELELGLYGPVSSRTPPGADAANRVVMATRDAHGIVTVTVAREVGSKDLLGAFAALMRGRPTPLVLWDLRAAHLSRFTREELQPTLMGLLRVSNAEPGSGRSAFVTSSDEDYAAVRMLATHAAQCGCAVKARVYRDLSVARAWLLGHYPE